MRWIRLLEHAVLVLLFSGMMTVAAWQVIARNFFDTGLNWGDALVRVLVLWVALFGGMVASRKDEHIRIDILSRLAPPRLMPWLQRIVALATAVLLGAFAWISFRTVQESYAYGDIAFAAVPLWVTEAIIPFGIAVMCLRYIAHVIHPPLREPL
jgi:TRAP-type C4-dicarboxylate transport system permease small subunit